jgi:hypothetical protein
MTMENFGLPPVRLTSAFLALFLAGFAGGCGGGAPKTFDAAAQATITGKVTLDGSKPVPLDSTITFYCAEKAATATAKVDALGSYSIKAQEKAIGVPGGRYKITVRPAEATPAQVGTDDYKKSMMSGATAAKQEIKSDIPSKFNALDTTPIVLEIKPGPNTIDIDLSKL